MQPKSLRHVAWPVLTFESIERGALDDPWQVGRTYDLKLRLLGIIPLGRHCIRLVKIDKATNTIESRESGLLARVWNHTIRFSRQYESTVSYSDEIEIGAGLLTPIVWAFAHLFYRYRQWRWKSLLMRRQ
jgi:hypothetical protein